MAVAPESVRLVEEPADVDHLEPAVAEGRRAGRGSPGPDDIEPRRVGRHRRAGPVPLPRPLDAQPQRPVLRHHQPAVCAQGPGRRGRRRGRHRFGQLVQHHGPDRRWRPPSGAHGCSASTRPTSCPTTSRGQSGSRPERRPPKRWSRPSSSVWHRARVSSIGPVTIEEEYFPPPPELRELFRSLETALSLLAGVPSDDGHRPESRTARLVRRPRGGAADVLAELERGFADRPIDPDWRENERMTATSFTSMDVSTGDQWATIGRETFAHQGRVADRVLGPARVAGRRGRRFRRRPVDPLPADGHSGRAGRSRRRDGGCFPLP